MQKRAVILSVTEARERVRTAGLRATTSRVAVLQHVSAAGKPVSHADVADNLVPQGYDKSTLYRCLVELADAGLLARLDAGDHAWRFEAKGANDEHARSGARIRGRHGAHSKLSGALVGAEVSFYHLAGNT